MSLIVTRQDREGMEAKYHIVFSSPQSRTGPTEPGCDSIWPQSKEKSLDLLPRRDAAFAEPMEAHSICRLRDDQVSFNDGSMRRSIGTQATLDGDCLEGGTCSVTTQIPQRTPLLKSRRYLPGRHFHRWRSAGVSRRPSRPFFLNLAAGSMEYAQCSRVQRKSPASR